MDDAFGRLMDAIDKQALRDRTFVFFTSDNGPAITNQHPHGSAGPLRDKKGAVYEGGIRVPGIIRWPGHATPGAVSDEPVCGVDLLPTVCAIAGIPAPADRKLDGASLPPLFEGKPVPRTKPLYWHFNRATSSPKVAIRDGDWKLLATLDRNPPARGNDITEESERDFKQAALVKFELYNLRSDIGEKSDLSAAEPARLAEMRARLEQMYSEVRDEAPKWPAWQFTGAEGKKIIWPDYVRKPKPAPAKSR
jgi:arylsulfatase A